MLAYVIFLLYLCAEKQKMNAESNDYHIIHPFVTYKINLLWFIKQRSISRV